MELITLLKSGSNQSRCCFPTGGCSADSGFPERWRSFFLGTSVNLLGAGVGYKRVHFRKVQGRIFFGFFFLFIVFFYFPFNATARQALARQYPAEFPVPRMLSCLEKKGS